METNKKFKPFDKVLVRDVENVWQPDFYCFWDKCRDKHQTMNDGFVADYDILPYEGNEEFVGTIDEPEKEILINYWEWVMASNVCYEDPSTWHLEQYANIKGEDSLETKNKHYYHYFIKFSDFNPDDMEATKKHILCVKNGKVVKYKD